MAKIRVMCANPDYLSGEGAAGFVCQVTAGAIRHWSRAASAGTLDVDMSTSVPTPLGSDPPDASSVPRVVHAAGSVPRVVHAEGSVQRVAGSSGSGASGARADTSVVGVDSAAAVEVESLSKHYGEVEAVKGVSFSVLAGEVFAFLGPNGAGKSTTIKMLCTLARPTAGRARVAGFDVARQPKAVRRHIGLVFQDQTLDDQLTAEENLRFHAVLYGVPHEQVATRIDRVLRLVALQDRRADLVSTFSGGMARRLEIARGMLHTPAVLFLDEPTVGLDPQTRALMWDDVLRMRDEEGVTIFLTTHYMDEAENADRIAIIDYGAIVALDTPDALKRQVGSDTVELATADDAAAGVRLASAGFSVRSGGTGLVVFAEHGESQVARLVEAAGVAVRNVHVHRPTLDDVFLHYTGRQIRETPADRSVGRSMRARMARRR